MFYIDVIIVLIKLINKLILLLLCVFSINQTLCVQRWLFPLENLFNLSIFDPFESNNTHIMDLLQSSYCRVRKVIVRLKKKKLY